MYVFYADLLPAERQKNEAKYIFREEEIRHVLNGVLTQTQKTARTDAK